MPSLIHTMLPPFRMQAFQEGDFRGYTHEDLRGHWSVLFFYPADFTFVCPTELADLEEHRAAFSELGVNLYAISCDTHFTHKAWHDASETIRKIRYPMLADPTGNLSRALGVYNEAEGIARRGTFVFNPEGQLVIAEIHDDGIGRNAAELLRKVQAAVFVREHPNEVCPARWSPGAATLKPGLDLVGKI